MKNIQIAIAILVCQIFTTVFAQEDNPALPAFGIKTNSGPVLIKFSSNSSIVEKIDQMRTYLKDRDNIPASTGGIYWTDSAGVDIPVAALSRLVINLRPESNSDALLLLTFLRDCDPIIRYLVAAALQRHFDLSIVTLGSPSVLLFEEPSQPKCKAFVRELCEGIELNVTK